MATASVKYYSGTIELKNVYNLARAKFLAIGGVRSKHNRCDGFSDMVGHPVEGGDAILPVTRTIFYKRFPSKHVCDARCRHAKGHNCECSCGGKFHGAGN